MEIDRRRSNNRAVLSVQLIGFPYVLSSKPVVIVCFVAVNGQVSSYISHVNKVNSYRLVSAAKRGPGK